MKLKISWFSVIGPTNKSKPAKHKRPASKEIQMRAPNRIFHTHQASGPTWHNEPDPYGPFDGLSGRTITRQGSPKMYYVTVTAFLLIAGYVMAKVVFHIV